MLKRFGVGINEAANGVFLPENLKSMNPAGSAVHSTLHKLDYYKAVNEALAQATTKAEVLEIHPPDFVPRGPTLMSDVYAPQPLDGFELCLPPEGGFEALNVALNGVPLGSAWHSPEFHLVHSDGNEPLAESDCPWLGSNALVFRRGAMDAIGDMLERDGEILDAYCREAKLVLFNATRLVDALDEGASSLKRFSNGRIMRVTRYAFHPQAIKGLNLFKIPNLRVSPTFVSENFVKAWTDANLRGLAFKKL